jgi:hypothetical protein
VDQNQRVKLPNMSLRNWHAVSDQNERLLLAHCMVLSLQPLVLKDDILSRNYTRDSSNRFLYVAAGTSSNGPWLAMDRKSSDWTLLTLLSCSSFRDPVFDPADL